MQIKIDLRKTVPENADAYYQESKKAQRKTEGARKALEQTLKKIDELEAQKEKVSQEFKMPEKKEKAPLKWYERFRWFTSSNGFLVIGGKDSTTNEIIIKKHLEKNDLVFHADVQGAPFFVIKNPESASIPTETLNETAQMAASYSKAWKAGWGSCDIYYVEPEQVSKTTKAGEYLPKGAFMIYGKKNWFKKTELAIAIGSDPENGEILSGPPSYVKSKTPQYVIIGPGDRKSKQIAEDVKKQILQLTRKELHDKIKKTPLEDIQKWIPAGKGRIKKQKS